MEVLAFISGFLGVIILVGTFIEIMGKGTANCKSNDYYGFLIGGILVIISLFLS